MELLVQLLVNLPHEPLLVLALVRVVLAVFLPLINAVLIVRPEADTFNKN